MKIAISTVTLDGYYEARAKNAARDVIASTLQQRLDVFEQALQSAHLAKVDLLCFPGGFFFCRRNESSDPNDPLSDANLVELRDEVVRRANKYHVGFAVGCDLMPKDLSQDATESIRAGRLTWCSICWSPEDNRVRSWNQRSINSKNQRDCPGHLCQRVQSIMICGKEVEILLCGELFNQHIRTAITHRERRPVAVVDLAHTLKGFRATRALEDYSRHGVHAFCSGHAQLSNAMKFYYAPEAINRSVREVDFQTTGDDGPRLQAKIWAI